MASLAPEGLDQPLSLKTGTPSSSDVLLIAHGLGPSWKMLGRVLGLHNNVLVQIDQDEGILAEKCYSVLNKWIQTFAADATYQCLAEALQHHTVGLSLLAFKYCYINAYRDTSEAAADSRDGMCKASDASPSSYSVFLSYPWDIQDKVQILKSKIEESGFQCWMDIKQMGGGDALLAKLDAGIRASKVFVCCVTESYIQSRICQREATLADQLKKPIIPLLFEKITWPPKGQLSLIFTSLLYIRISDKDGMINASEYNQLIQQVQQFVQNSEN